MSSSQREGEKELQEIEEGEGLGKKKDHNKARQEEEKREGIRGRKSGKQPFPLCSYKKTRQT